MIEENKVKNLNIASEILIEPWITEAATKAGEQNKYIFKVAKKANKIQIKKSIEELYKVKVLDVKTINIPSKKRLRGRILGTKSGFRKAIIELKQGDSINVFGTK